MSNELVRHVAMPALPDREVARLKSDAIMLARTNLIPSALRNKPEDVLALVAWGAAIGLEPAVAVQAIYLIEGRPYPSGRALVAAANARGHRVQCVRSTATECTVRALRQGDDPSWVVEVTYTLDEAKAAGLTSKDVWKKYGADMLFWRAARRAVDRTCPEVVLGLGDAGFAMLDDDEGQVHQAVTVTATVDQPPALEAPAPDRFPFPKHWSNRCVALGVSREVSQRLIYAATEGLTTASADVPEGMQATCEELLDQWARDRPADVVAWLEQPEATE